MPSYAPNPNRKTKLGISAAIVGAFAASICCVGPLVLLTLGVSGAWIGNLTVMEPYRPLFIALTLSFLAYASIQAYGRARKQECKPGSFCASPTSQRGIKVGLWVVAVLVLGLIAFPYTMPTQTRARQSLPVITERVALAVAGMTCNGCVLTVRSSLTRLEGVVSVRVTFAPPRAVVEYDPQAVGVTELIRATTQAGYPSKPLNLSTIKE